MSSQKYTLKDVAFNNGVEKPSVWIIINDLVYDVTVFMNEHPGGRELIAEWAGKDATKDFKGAGHSSDAMKDLKNYLIGELVEEDKQFNQSKPIKTKVENSQQFQNEKTKLKIFCCF